MPDISRRAFLTGAAALGTAASAAVRPGRRPRRARSAAARPNLVVIFADDLGYGDLGCFGHPTIRTPRLDQMAAEGTKLTQFYSAESVCTPSRAALLTGRLPIRSGMCSDSRRVLFPDSAGGLPADEVTVAELLQHAGYATACVGKWHLGHHPQHLPTRRGFDEYFGIPYSNDMKPCPLMEGERVIEEPAEQTSLTRRYTERATAFIEAHADEPFFLYLPQTFPHVPLHAGPEFRGTSARGLYGDVVEELDWSVGRVLDTLRRRGLAERTLVLFCSDNGPWTTQRLRGGSAGLLRGGKGSTWEGGMREPTLAWWPGHIPAGAVQSGLGATLDLLPTACALAGIDAPADRALDGYDLLPMLTSGAPSPRPHHFFWRGTQLHAVRWGPWKAHFITRDGYGGGQPEAHDPPLLFNLAHDPSEQYPIDNPDPQVLSAIRALVDEHRASIQPVPSQLEARIPEGEAPGPMR